MTFDTLAFTRALADELGDDWLARPGYHHRNNDARLHGPDQVEIHVHAGFRQSERGRAFLAGSLPDGVRYGWPRHEISVSQAKTPAQVARDVNRRLLPVYRDTLARALDAKARDEAAAAARDELISDLAGILGGRRIPHDDSLRFGAFREGISGAVEARKGSGYARFEIEVPAEQAAELAAYLEKLR